MANTKYFGKGIAVAAGFDLSSQSPLDSRTVVASLAERDSIDVIKLYEGLRVYVEENETTYEYTKKVVTRIETVTDETSGEESQVEKQETVSYWRQCLSEDDLIETVDNLISTDPKKNLSANQGRVLDEKIGATNSELNAFKTEYTNKMTELDTTDIDLQKQITDNKAAYDKFVEDYNQYVIDNKKYIDDADKVLQDNIDTLETNTTSRMDNIEKEYKAKDTVLEAAINVNATDIETLNDNLNLTIDQVNANSNAIDVLNGDDTTEGSVAKAISDLSDKIYEDVSKTNTKRHYTERLTVTQAGQTDFAFGIILPSDYSVLADTMRIYVNGLTYIETTSFKATRAFKMLQWTNTEANGGFDLEEDDVVQVDYVAAQDKTNVTKVVYITPSDDIKTVGGDYEVDPATYSETFDLTSYDITGDVVSVLVNGVTYSTSDRIAYNTDTKSLTLYGLKTQSTDEFVVLDKIS